MAVKIKEYSLTVLEIWRVQLKRKGKCFRLFTKVYLIQSLQVSLGDEVSLHLQKQSIKEVTKFQPKSHKEYNYSQVVQSCVINSFSA